MKTTFKYTIEILVLSIFMTACGGGDDNPSPEISIVGREWTLATVNNSSDSDEKTTFVLQKFTLSEDGNYSATFYPNITQSGTWTESGANYSLDASGSIISLNNVSIDDNTLTTSVVVAAGVGGKVAEFSATVTYTR